MIQNDIRYMSFQTNIHNTKYQVLFFTLNDYIQIDLSIRTYY